MRAEAEDLLSKEVLLLDGGLGTTLEDQYQVKFTSKTPLWSSHMLVDSPDTLLHVQQRFVKAGSDVLLTATYQASKNGFKATITNDHPDGINELQADTFMRKAITISREAFGGRPGIVALSLGAYGATMVPGQEYSGAYDVDEDGLVDFHLRRLKTFMNAREWDEVDCLAFETLPRVNEIRAVRRLMQTVSELDKLKPYWISCVFPADNRLPDGSSIEDALSRMLESPGVPPFAVGLNCTKVHRIADIVHKYEATAARLDLVLPRLVLYPDGAGNLVYDTTQQKWVGVNNHTEPWDLQVFHIVEGILGRDQWKGLILGGCCKTAPGDIASLRARLDERDHKVGFD